MHALVHGQLCGKNESTLDASNQESQRTTHKLALRSWAQSSISPDARVYFTCAYIYDQKIKDSSRSKLSFSSGKKKLIYFYGTSINRTLSMSNEARLRAQQAKGAKNCNEVRARFPNGTLLQNDLTGWTCRWFCCPGSHNHDVVAIHIRSFSLLASIPQCSQRRWESAKCMATYFIMVCVWGGRWIYVPPMDDKPRRTTYQQKTIAFRTQQIAHKVLRLVIQYFSVRT